MSALARDGRGAVMVETLIAFMPLFTVFMCLVQLSFVEIANVVTKHSAVLATRAAVVVLPDDSAYYDSPVQSPTGKRLEEITTAAKLPLTTLSTDPKPSLSFPSAFGDQDVLRVRVTYDFPCRVPIANRIVCGLDAKKRLVHESALPNQGSRYEYP